MANILKPKVVKGFVVSNKLQFIIGFIFILLGIIVGVVIQVPNEDTTIFASSTVSLEDLIVGDASAGSLFFSNFIKLMLPIIIIFMFSLNKYTGFLNYLYLLYQGMLLGISVTSVIIDNGFTGALNSLVFIAPVNLINLTIITYASALFTKRREYSKKFRKSFGQSFGFYLGETIWLLIGTLVSSVIYGVIYPIILRSMIIVNY